MKAKVQPFAEASYSAHFASITFRGKVRMNWSCGMPQFSTKILRISRS